MDIDIIIVLCSAVGALTLCVGCFCCAIRMGRRRAEADRDTARQQFCKAASTVATADLTVAP